MKLSSFNIQYQPKKNQQNTTFLMPFFYSFYSLPCSNNLLEVMISKLRKIKILLLRITLLPTLEYTKNIMVLHLWALTSIYMSIIMKPYQTQLNNKHQFERGKGGKKERTIIQPKDNTQKCTCTNERRKKKQ